MIYKKCNKCFQKYEYGKKCPCSIKHYKQMNVIKGTDDDFYTSRKWRKLRQQILNRDGAYCQRCLHKYSIITTSNLEIHHIVARSVNTELEYEPTNLVTVCKTCNLQLGTNGVDWEHEAKKLPEYSL